MGLGSYPTVTLAAAREKARDASLLLAGGRDPIAQRQRAAPLALTFQSAGEEFIADKREGWRHDKTAHQWGASLKHAYKYLGRLPTAEISIEHVVSALRPIWNKTPESALKLRGRIENILDWATARGLRTGENPARMKVLRHLLPRQRRIGGHYKAMPYRDVPVFLRTLSKQKSMGAIALYFLILTAARSGEVRGATWDEIDLNKAIWSLPAERMKGGRPHVVPLSAGALKVLHPLHKTARSTLVFEGMKRGRPLSDMSLTATLRRMGIPATAHGFRSSFRDWCGETGHPREVAEAALAHLSGDQTERAYARSDLFERRRGVMKAWDRFCHGA